MQFERPGDLRDRPDVLQLRLIADRRPVLLSDVIIDLDRVRAEGVVAVRAQVNCSRVPGVA